MLALFSRIDSLHYVLICCHESADKSIAKIAFVCINWAHENLLAMKLNAGKIYLVWRAVVPICWAVSYNFGIRDSQKCSCACLCVLCDKSGILTVFKTAREEPVLLQPGSNAVFSENANGLSVAAGIGCCCL